MLRRARSAIQLLQVGAQANFPVAPKTPTPHSALLREANPFSLTQLLPKPSTGNIHLQQSALHFPLGAKKTSKSKGPGQKAKSYRRAILLSHATCLAKLLEEKWTPRFSLAAACCLADHSNRSPSKLAVGSEAGTGALQDSKLLGLSLSAQST